MTDVPDERLAEIRPIRQSRRWGRLSFAQWPISVVLFGLGVALVMIGTDHFRRGSIVLSASVLLATFLRLMMSNGDVGMLAVRSRRTDVLVLAALGIGLTIFTFWVPAPN